MEWPFRNVIFVRSKFAIVQDEKKKFSSRLNKVTKSGIPPQQNLRSLDNNKKYC